MLYQWKLFFLLWLIVLTPCPKSSSSKVFVSPQEVADHIFPPMRVSLDDIYFQRLVLRFSRPWLQIVITRPFGGDPDQIQIFAVDSPKDVDKFINEINAGSEQRSAEEIAKEIRVVRKNVSLRRKDIDLWFHELTMLKLSPRLDSYICGEGCSQFDLWFDTRQDSVRYSFSYSPAMSHSHSTQQSIAEWMQSLMIKLNSFDTGH